MKRSKQTKKIYPIHYNDRLYYEKDCNEVFIGFYSGPDSLGESSSVYVCDGLRVCPDGKWINQ